MEYEILEFTEEEFNLLLDNQQSEMLPDEEVEEQLEDDSVVLHDEFAYYGESSTLVELPPSLIDNVSDIRKYTLLIFLFLVIALGIALVNKITNLFD